MIEHNHNFTAVDYVRKLHPNCPRCLLEDAAEELAEACREGIRIIKLPINGGGGAMFMIDVIEVLEAALKKAGVEI